MSTIIAPVLQDTYVDSAQPNNSFYTARRLVMGIDQDALGSVPWGDGVGTGGLCRPWIMRDLSTIPSGSTINSATLQVPVYWSRNDYVDQYYYIIRSTDVTWVGSALTYNNAPNGTLDTANAILVNQGSGSGGVTTNITSLVNSAMADGKIAICLKTQGDFESFDSDFFTDITSKYYVDNYDGTKAPCTLTIDYTEPAGARRFIVSSFT